MSTYTRWDFIAIGKTNRFGDKRFEISHNHIFPLGRLAEPSKGIFLSSLSRFLQEILDNHTKSASTIPYIRQKVLTLPQTYEQYLCKKLKH